jgi:hypothetical protein
MDQADYIASSGLTFSLYGVILKRLAPTAKLNEHRPSSNLSGEEIFQQKKSKEMAVAVVQN